SSARRSPRLPVSHEGLVRPEWAASPSHPFLHSTRPLAGGSQDGPQYGLLRRKSLIAADPHSPIAERAIPPAQSDSRRPRRRGRRVHAGAAPPPPRRQAPHRAGTRRQRRARDDAAPPAPRAHRREPRGRRGDRAHGPAYDRKKERNDVHRKRRSVDSRNM